MFVTGAIYRPSTGYPQATIKWGYPDLEIVRGVWYGSHMSNTYKDKKVRHTQELRRSGASGFHSPRGYKRKEKYPDNDLKFYTKNSKVKEYE